MTAGDITQKTSMNKINVKLYRDKSRIWFGRRGTGRAL